MQGARPTAGDRLGGVYHLPPHATTHTQTRALGDMAAVCQQEGSAGDLRCQPQRKRQMAHLFPEARPSLRPTLVMFIPICALSDHPRQQGGPVTAQPGGPRGRH